MFTDYNIYEHYNTYFSSPHNISFKLNVLRIEQEWKIKYNTNIIYKSETETTSVMEMRYTNKPLSLSTNPNVCTVSELHWRWCVAN